MNAIVSLPYQSASNPSIRNLAPRPTAMAIVKREALIPAAPASSTNTLKGAGGGSSDGISTAITPCRRIAASVRSTNAELNRRRPPHHRQHYPGLAADRRRLAAAAAPAERDSRSNRPVLSHRRFGRRHIRRVVRCRDGCHRLDRQSADPIGGGGGNRRAGIRA